MSYFDHNAAKANMPAKTKPVATYTRQPRSEACANRELAKGVRK